jgi:hypothetical protein
MNTTVDIYLGAPIAIESEREFLARLKSHLENQGRPGLILANFLLPPNRPAHQVDFLIVARPCVCHVELKQLTKPVVGSSNGPWSLREPDGSLTPLDAKNPFRQALDCKYVISDAMAHFAARARELRRLPQGKKFYSFFESVVCVYPNLLPSSAVPNQKWVRVMGYSELLDLLEGRDINPGWTLENWIEFAMHLGLVRQRSGDEVASPDVEAADRSIRLYQARFMEFYSTGLPALVPTTIQQSDRMTDSTSLRGFLLEGSHAQLVGPSGCGKTHLAKHMAIAAVDGGRLPIIASAKLYDGKLSSLLDRSVAHLHPDTAIHFLTLARKAGAPVSLILDGINECPKGLRQSLLQDVQAFVLRWQTPVVSTTQVELTLPSCLSGASFVFCELTGSQREALLREYAAGTWPSESRSAELFAPCRTAYDLTLAASCMAEASARASRAGLYDAYVRRCCEQSREAAVVRRALREIAVLMYQRISMTISVANAWRVTEQVIHEASAPISVMQDVLGSRLLEVGQGECAFRHELLQRFLAAEGFAIRHATSSEIGFDLSKPRNRDLAEFVLGLQTEPSCVRACLRALADSQLLCSCFRGEVGPIAEQVVKEDAMNVFQFAQDELDQITLEIHQAEGGRAELRVSGCREWSSYDQALLSTLGDRARGAFSVEESLRLLRNTWNTCLERLEKRYGRTEVQKRSVQSGAFAELFVSGGAKLPASLVSGACQRCFMAARSPEGQQKVLALCEESSSLSAPELYVIFQILKDGLHDAGAVLPRLLKAGWETGIYHVQLEALQFAELAGRSVDASFKDEVVRLLNSFKTWNPFLRGCSRSPHAACLSS